MTEFYDALKEAIGEEQSEDAIATKLCNSCNRQLPKHYFYARSGCCKKCQKKRVKDWASNNPERRKEIQSRYNKYKKEEKLKIRGANFCKYPFCYEEITWARKYCARHKIKTIKEQKKLDSSKRRKIDPKKYIRRSVESARKKKMQNLFEYVWSLAKSNNRVKPYGGNLDREWVNEHIKTGKCERTGITLTWTVGKFSNPLYRIPTNASIHRLNNDIGHTKENCIVVCWWYNHAIKMFKTDEIALKFLQQVSLKI